MRFAMMLPLVLATAAAGCSSSSAVETAPGPQTVRVIGSGAGSIAMSMSASAPDPRASTIAAPLADVWRVLPAAYESLNIPVSTVDTTTRVMGNSGFNTRRRLGTIPLVRLIDCGTTQGGPSAETYDIHMTVTTHVRTVEGGTSLSTTVEPMGKPVAFSGEYIRCSSTGALELRLADAVKARLAK
jgi:hypothetical protein